MDWELFVGGKATITHKKGQGRRPGAITQKARRSRAVKGADAHALSLSDTATASPQALYKRLSRVTPEY